MPAEVNNTNIVLIPKIQNPVKITDFPPISLCNIIYKVVSKCLVNRLRPVLNGIISPTQSAFIPGQMIMDNSLIAFECIHHIKQEKDPRRSFCAYKLNLSKAYDRVDWDYLKQMMQKLGFAHRWVDWIMSCVTPVRYSIKFNGAISDSFAPSCGLRQGDPLSPYLFLLVADGLSILFNKGIDSSDLSPLKITRRAPGISHLLFADDTLLFFKATGQQANTIKQIIKTYEQATGQLLNPAKSSILFGKCIGMLGRKCCERKNKEGLALGISDSLIKRCLQGKRGGY